jgi:hypothetical protein
MSTFAFDNTGLKCSLHWFVSGCSGGWVTKAVRERAPVKKGGVFYVNVSRSSIGMAIIYCHPLVPTALSAWRQAVRSVVISAGTEPGKNPNKH